MTAGGGGRIIAVTVLAALPLVTLLAPGAPAQAFTGVEVRVYAILSKAKIYRKQDYPPVPAARVDLRGDGGRDIAVVTDDNGVARVELPPGTYQVRWTGTASFLVPKGCEEATALVVGGKRTIVDLLAFDLIDGHPQAQSPTGSYSFHCPSTWGRFGPDD